MRLFIAIAFSEKVKRELEKSAALLRSACVKGSFSPRENYHLTLSFLGEQPESRLAAIKSAMDACACPRAQLRIGGLGRFRQRDGDVLWRSVELPAELLQMQRELSRRLSDAGFSPEDREFRPHLTLARRAELRAGESLQNLSAKLEDIDFTPGGISLMLSRHRDGRQVYTCLYERKDKTEEARAYDGRHP